MNEQYIYVSADANEVEAILGTNYPEYVASVRNIPPSEGESMEHVVGFRATVGIALNSVSNETLDLIARELLEQKLCVTVDYAPGVEQKNLDAMREIFEQERQSAGVFK